MAVMAVSFTNDRSPHMQAFSISSPLMHTHGILSFRLLHSSAQIPYKWNHRIMESWNDLGWKILQNFKFQVPVMGGDRSH